jgi:16S rRNA processing protein RimM
VTDIRIGEVGIVSNVVDIKSNPLLVVISNDKKEILIPIFEGLVKKVNRKSKILLIEAPEGLIELYL